MEGTAHLSLHADHTLEAMIQRGRGFRNLEDKQAFEMGVAHELGVALLSPDAQQLATLIEPM